MPAESTPNKFSTVTKNSQKVNYNSNLGTQFTVVFQNVALAKMNLCRRIVIFAILFVFCCNAGAQEDCEDKSDKENCSKCNTYRVNYNLLNLWLLL